ncbi:unnamed protein product, partial [Thlaspi arvense]
MKQKKEIVAVFNDDEVSSLLLYITSSSPLFPDHHHHRYHHHSLSLFRFLVSDSRSSVLISIMATGNKGRQLPKFGDWDASDPASAQGFTVIFNNARDDKKTKKTAVAGPESLVSPAPINDQPRQNNNHHHNNRKSQTPQAKVP